MKNERGKTVTQALYLKPVRAKVKKLHAVYNALGKYHRHKVVGSENLVKEGRSLLVFNHSLATYDMSIMIAKVRHMTGRVVMGLGDDLWFRLPLVGQFLAETGTVRACPIAAEELLNKDEILLVAPGGMREALKPSSESNLLHWDSRKGFVRLAIKTQAPITLVACPEADDIYTVYDNRLTKMVYKRLRLPLMIVRGFGPSLIPRPVQLTHYISEPLLPPKVDINNEKAFEQVVDHWHAELTAKMNQMLTDHRKK